MTENETPHIGPHGVGCKCPPQITSAKVGMFARVRNDLAENPLKPVYEIIYFDGEKVSEGLDEMTIAEKHAAAIVQITIDTQSEAAVATMQLMRDQLGDHFQATIEAHTSKMMKGDLMDALVGDMVARFLGEDIANLLKKMKKPETSTEADDDSPARDEF